MSFIKSYPMYQHNVFALKDDLVFLVHFNNKDFYYHYINGQHTIEVRYSNKHMDYTTHVLIDGVGRLRVSQSMDAVIPYFIKKHALQLIK